MFHTLKWQFGLDLKFAFLNVNEMHYSHLHPDSGTTCSPASMTGLWIHWEGPGSSSVRRWSQKSFEKFLKRWWRYLKTKPVTWLKCEVYYFEGLQQSTRQDFKNLNTFPNLIWWRVGYLQCRDKALRYTRLSYLSQRLNVPVLGEQSPGFRVIGFSSQLDNRNGTSVSSHRTPGFFTRAHIL